MTTSEPPRGPGGDLPSLGALLGAPIDERGLDALARMATDVATAFAGALVAGGGGPAAASLRPLEAAAALPVDAASPATAALVATGLYFVDEAWARGASAGPVKPATPSAASRLPVGRRLPFDAAAVRSDFPILTERVHGAPLVWLDNAATTQKPRRVIDRITRFYEHENSNIHRAAHTLAARATDAYEAAREQVRVFLNAPSARDIVFVRGATEAINLVAQSYGRQHVGPGDEVVVTQLEHHSNIVPWQQLVAERGARLRVVPVDDHGDILLDEYEKLLGPRTRIVSLTQVSNAIGTVTPVREMVERAHRHGAVVLVDGAQAVSHMPVDVQALGCDFYVLSGHKVFAPTGIGALYGRADLLDATQPWQGGGNMIADVTFTRTVYQPAPARFEAGTGNIADAVGLGEALSYLGEVGLENVARHEHGLLERALAGLLRIDGVKVIGSPRERAGVLSFVIEGLRPEQVGAALDRDGIAVRSGHHCAQPALRRFGHESTVRPSFALYNTVDDVDALLSSIKRLQSGRSHRFVS